LCDNENSTQTFSKIWRIVSSLTETSNQTQIVQIKSWRFSKAIHGFWCMLLFLRNVFIADFLSRHIWPDWLGGSARGQAQLMQPVACLVGWSARLSSCKILLESWPDAYGSIELRSGARLMFWFYFLSYFFINTSN
jgi:hypothetical protein